jgi:hypothetical protein
LKKRVALRQLLKLPPLTKPPPLKQKLRLKLPQQMQQQRQKPPPPQPKRTNSLYPPDSV